MSTARNLHHPYADYLRLEREAPMKLEFSAGEIYAMAGGTPAHGALAFKLGGLLSAQLPSDCRGYSSDVKVRIQAADLATYPDFSIVCGSIVHSPDDPNAITNPRILVEVTSPSTEEYDRGGKLRSYQLLPSVEAVVIVSHQRREVTVVRRVEGRWETREARAGARVKLPAGLEFAVDELYSVVELQA